MHQHDARPPEVALRAFAVRNHAIEPLAITRPKPHLNAFPHATRSAPPGQ
jgi:hypothetical protein